ncbi:MAG: prepilin-type N-terminal cleavage/methylation domain-containing protein [Candidatus Krumholzibacteria bacterium]|nr:prepilin-type N-terminal cleavage/methylation domain-containing protein [Candidatus Krumholzibacteria bacterium]
MRMKKRIGGTAGMTLVEILVGITIFAIGVLGLTRVMFQAMQANVKSKHLVVATNLAHQRMEQIISSMRYDNITATNFPTEDYGAINGSSADYSFYRRTVTIADSLNALNSSVMKEVIVRVEWREKGGTRNVEMHSSIARFKDINL